MSETIIKSYEIPIIGEVRIIKAGTLYVGAYSFDNTTFGIAAYENLEKTEIETLKVIKSDFNQRKKELLNQFNRYATDRYRSFSNREKKEFRDVINKYKRGIEFITTKITEINTQDKSEEETK